jgi:hypothetical protein
MAQWHYSYTTGDAFGSWQVITPQQPQVIQVTGVDFFEQLLKQKLKKYHPDKPGGNEERTKMLVELLDEFKKLKADSDGK